MGLLGQRSSPVEINSRGAGLLYWKSKIYFKMTILPFSIEDSPSLVEFN